MIDFVITFIILIFFSLQYIFLWMMIQLKKRGYYYPILSKTRNIGVISDFKTRITYDKELKSKYKRLLNIIKLILGLILIVFMIFKYIIID